MQHVLLIFALAIGTYLVAYSSSLTQEALTTAQQRGQELVKASLEAEQAALAEREAREREERIAGELRQAVREYSSFLQQVVAGDYSARLELKEAEGPEEIPSELMTFGQQLNDAVETLVAALSDLQAVQQRYLQQAWEAFSTTRGTHRGYHFQAAEVEPADAAWLEPMTEAVTEQAMVTTEREVAMPIALRGQIIGALGARREGAAAWSSADIALVEAITDQLAQTMESLRLLDETQRSAAHDRIVGEVTTRMRETLDVETVLKTAVDEISRTLGLAALDLRLGSGDEAHSQTRRVMEKEKDGP
jgi:GAF domain-containing protein